MTTFLKKRSGWVTLVGAVFTVVGIISAYYLPSRWERTKAIAKEPQTLTLQELETNGYGDNPHVILTEYTCSRDYAVHYVKQRSEPEPGPDNRGIGTAWIPLAPKPPQAKGDMRDFPDRFNVVLETSQMTGTRNEFRLLNQRKTIQGLVIPLSRRDLPTEVREKLAASYPAVNLDQCVAFVQYEPLERKDAEIFLILHTIAAFGGLMMGIPVFLLGLRLGRRRPRNTKSPQSE